MLKMMVDKVLISDKDKIKIMLIINILKLVYPRFPHSKKIKQFFMKNIDFIHECIKI